MAPANNFGGSIAGFGGIGGAVAASGGGLVITGSGSILAIAPNPSGPSGGGVAPPLLGTVGVSRGGGRRRIAPTPVSQATGLPIGAFGESLESAVTHARSLTAQQRRDETARLQRELAAIAQVNAEEGNDEIEDEDEEEGEGEGEGGGE